MAKAKRAVREYVFMECDVCRNRNYRTSHKTAGAAAKLELKKYCKFCRAHTVHKERRK
jgi:large subunit ribosomal protein L33